MIDLIDGGSTDSPHSIKHTRPIRNTTYTCTRFPICRSVGADRPVHPGPANQVSPVKKYNCDTKKKIE